MHKKLALAFALLALLLSGCSTVDVTPTGQPLDRGAKWALLPIVNHTEAPQAGLRAEVITEGLLRVRGIADLARYPAELNPDTVFEPAERKVVEEAMNWARQQRVRYAVTGAVDEWRYKVGVDGEPAVGFTLQVLDLDSGKVVWSAVAGKSGWSRQALSAVGQDLLRKMIGEMPLAQGATR